MTTMTPDQMLEQADLTAGFAAMMKGPMRRVLRKRAAKLMAAAFEVKFGPVTPETRAMSDAELLAALATA